MSFLNKKTPESIYQDKKDAWVLSIIDKTKGGWDWNYREYLRQFYDDVFSKGKVVNPLDYDAWRDYHKKELRQKREAWNKARVNRINNSRIKLTNAEKYLAYKSGIGELSHYIGDDGSGTAFDKVSKTPAEIRQAVKRMRLRVDYQALHDLDCQIRASHITDAQQLHDLFYCADKTWRQSRYGINLIHKIDSDLGRFVIAENNIKGMAEDEIKKLHLIEMV